MEKILNRICQKKETGSREGIGHFAFTLSSLTPEWALLHNL